MAVRIDSTLFAAHWCGLASVGRMPPRTALHLLEEAIDDQTNAEMSRSGGGGSGSGGGGSSSANSKVEIVVDKACGLPSPGLFGR